MHGKDTSRILRKKKKNDMKAQRESYPFAKEPLNPAGVEDEEEISRAAFVEMSVIAYMTDHRPEAAASKIDPFLPTQGLNTIYN